MNATSPGPGHEHEPGGEGGLTTGEAQYLRRYFADAPNRLIGFLIDAVILTLLSFNVAVIVSLLFGPIVTIDPSGDPVVSLDRGLAVLNAALGTVISGVYFVATWRRFRGSPGQRLLEMRIASQDDGGQLTIRQGTLRWLFVGLPLGIEAFLTTALSGLGDALAMLALLGWYVFLLASIARSPTKQGLHDRVARTVVTKTARAVPSELEQGAGVR